MKIMFLIIHITLIAIAVGIQFTDVNYKTEIFYSGLGLIFINQVVWTLKSIRRRFSGDVVIKLNRKELNISTLILAPIWTLLCLYSKIEMNLLIFLWGVFITEVVTWILTFVHKPQYLIINRQSLIINDSWVSKRNIDDIKEIKLDSIFKYLQIYFNKDTSIYIKYKQIKKEDYHTLIKKLLEIVPEQAVIDERLIK